MSKNDDFSSFEAQLEGIKHQYLDLLAKSSDFAVIEFDQLPELCRERRRKLKLSLAGLAELTGLAIRTINKFEKGDDGISLRNVKLICHAIGIRPCIKS